jgi:hypothetical protein
LHALPLDEFLEVGFSKPAALADQDEPHVTRLDLAAEGLGREAEAFGGLALVDQ